MTQKERDQILHDEKNWLEGDPFPGPGKNVRLLSLVFQGNKDTVVLIRVQAHVWTEDWSNWRATQKHPMALIWRDIGLFTVDEKGRWQQASWTQFKEVMKQADRKKASEGE
jgi:hypothetical protein